MSTERTTTSPAPSLGCLALCSVLTALVCLGVLPGAMTCAYGQALGLVLNAGPHWGLSGQILRLATGPVSGGDLVDPAVGDWDGDGIADLLLGSGYGDLGLLRGGADGLYGSPEALLSPPAPIFDWPPRPRQVSPELADWDGDGRLDLLLGLDGQVYLYQRAEGGLGAGEALRTRDGQPVARQVPADAGHLAPSVGDADGDGDLDLLLGDEVGRVWLAENVGSRAGPRLSSPVELLVARALVAQAASLSSAPIPVRSGLQPAPSSGEAPEAEPPAPASAQDPAGPPVALRVEGRARPCLGDLTGDGRPDLAVGDAAGNLWLCVSFVAGFGSCQLLARLDGPTSPRLIVSGAGAPALLVGIRSGLVCRFALQGAQAVALGSVLGRDQPLDVGAAAVPVVADWDGDRDMDLLVGSDTGEVWLVERTRTGYALPRLLLDRLGAPIQAPGGDAWPCPTDLDGDGDLDLVLGCGDGSLRVWMNQGGLIDSGPLRTSGVELRVAGPSSVTAADYDGNGTMDLFVAAVGSTGGPLPLLNDRVLYLENAPAARPGGPTFVKAVPLDLFLRLSGAADGLQDAAHLRPRSVQLLTASARRVDFVVNTVAGAVGATSTIARNDYPVLVIEAPIGRPRLLVPPAHSVTIARLDGRPGLLCGLAPYGFACFYPDVLPGR